MPKHSTERRAGLTVARIDQREQLAELAPEWDRLVEMSDVASPFLTSGWQLAWLESYGSAHRPFVLAARLDGKLVGLWPLALRRRGLFRVLEPIGAGRSDWLDIPTIVDLREDVLAAFVDYLMQHRGAWDVIELRDILTDSPSIAALTALSTDGSLRLRQQPRTIAPYLSLDGTWEQFLAGKRPKFRSNLKYYRRLPERDGHKLEVRRVPWEDSADAVDVLAKIELGSWKAQDGNLKVSTPHGREFYRRFCRYFAERGALELWRADIDGVPVAFVLNIVYGGKVYHYNTCYEEKWAAISPGLLLHSQAIADAFERGLEEYDFLSGDEPYKERWCSNRREIEHVALFHGRPASLAAQTAIVEARWALRRSKTLTSGRLRLLSAVRRFVRRDVTAHA